MFDRNDETNISFLIFFSYSTNIWHSGKLKKNKQFVCRRVFWWVNVTPDSRLNLFNELYWQYTSTKPYIEDLKKVLWGALEEPQGSLGGGTRRGCRQGWDLWYALCFNEGNIKKSRSLCHPYRQSSHPYKHSLSRLLLVLRDAHDSNVCAHSEWDTSPKKDTGPARLCRSGATPYILHPVRRSPSGYRISVPLHRAQILPESKTKKRGIY